MTQRSTVHFVAGVRGNRDMQDPEAANRATDSMESGRLEEKEPILVLVEGRGEFGSWKVLVEQQT